MESIKYDEKNRALKFAVISDTHLQQFEKAFSNLKFDRALKMLNKRAESTGGPLDALVIVGDMTDNGDDNQIKWFAQCVEKNLNPHTKLLFSLGNHDIQDDYAVRKLGGIPFKRQLEKMIYLDADEQAVRTGNHHTVVNGFHFIMLTLYDYHHGRHTQEELDWLKEQLDQATADDQNKPVFISCHAVVKDTIWTLDDPYWYSDNVADVLKNYPQAVIFGGHLHFPLQHEREIVQTDFTSIGTSTTYYFSLDRFYNGIPYIDVRLTPEPSDGLVGSQGMFIEVDKAGAMKITKMDFHEGSDVKEPWMIPAPSADRSHLLPFNVERRKSAKTAPHFEKDAEIEVLKSGKSKLQLQFSAAKDSDCVICYEVKLTDSNGSAHKVMTYSDFYLHASPKDMSKKLRKYIMASDFGLEEFPGSFSIEIKALDSFGLESAPIKLNVGDYSRYIKTNGNALEKTPFKGLNYKPIYDFSFWDEKQKDIGTIDDESQYLNSADGAGIDYIIKAAKQNSGHMAMRIESVINKEENNRFRCINLKIQNPDNEYFDSEYPNSQYLCVKLDLTDYNGRFSLSPYIMETDCDENGNKAGRTLFAINDKVPFYIEENGELKELKTEQSMMVLPDKFKGNVYMPLKRDYLTPMWGTSDINNHFDGVMIEYINLILGDIGMNGSAFEISELGFVM